MAEDDPLSPYRSSSVFPCKLPDSSHIMSRFNWFEALKAIYSGIDSGRDAVIDQQTLLRELVRVSPHLNLLPQEEYFTDDQSEAAFSLSQVMTALSNSDTSLLTWDQLLDQLLQLCPCSSTRIQQVSKRPSTASDCNFQSSLVLNTVGTQSQGGMEGEKGDWSFPRHRLVVYPREMKGKYRVRTS